MNRVAKKVRELQQKYDITDQEIARSLDVDVVTLRERDSAPVWFHPAMHSYTAVVCSILPAGSPLTIARAELYRLYDEDARDHRGGSKRKHETPSAVER